MANVVLNFSDPNDRAVLIIGLKQYLACYDAVKTKLVPRVDAETYKAAINTLHPLPTDSISLWFNNATAAALPSKASRHNTPSRAHSITKLVKSCLSGTGTEVIVMVCEKDHAFASACAIGRAFPLFSRKAGYVNKTSKRVITVEFILPNGGSLTEEEIQTLAVSVDSVRLAARIVDTPCNEMNTDHFIEEVKKVGVELGLEPVIIQGESLQEKGFGGIYGVGKAAVHLPALAVLSYKPDHATQTIAWVGKGIVYDTGGLSIKGKTGMPGMKRDCGGAAGILGAFRAAVKMGFKENLHMVLCLAENAVGPIATRPDDIHVLYSGRSVEINNTDAEGRLVLGDGRTSVLAKISQDVIGTASSEAYPCNAPPAVSQQVCSPGDQPALAYRAVLDEMQGVSTVHSYPDRVTEAVKAYVAYAVRDLKADIILDMATLTGAQGISTGKYHAGLLTNSEEWEIACMKAGKNSADLVFPLVYCPELHFSEFGSAVADMKNSVADRGNAQSSCAGLFIGAHIGFDFPGVWIHIDMASPSYSGERATGYGVALLLSLFGRASSSSLLNSVSPLGMTQNNEVVENASKKIRLV